MRLQTERGLALLVLAGLAVAALLFAWGKEVLAGLALLPTITIAGRLLLQTGFLGERFRDWGPASFNVLAFGGSGLAGLVAGIVTATNVISASNAFTVIAFAVGVGNSACALLTVHAVRHPPGDDDHCGNQRIGETTPTRGDLQGGRKEHLS